MPTMTRSSAPAAPSKTLSTRPPHAPTASPTAKAVPVADRKLPLALRAYRLFTIGFTPFTPLLLNHRLRRGKEHSERLSERMGLSKLTRPQGPLIWMHGASVGELNAVLPLIERIRARDFN